MSRRPASACLSSLALAIFLSNPVAGVPHQVPGADATERCASLSTVDFSQIPDAVTEVTKTSLNQPADGASAYCEVSGYVAPNIRFLLRLPSGSWNGKLIEVGCGGACGTTEHISRCHDPLRRGYACIVSDGGNTSSGGDMKWAYNNPGAVINYLVVAGHVTYLAGKAIAERFYAKPPDKSYFLGCSAGGIQAMTEAQRFPWDFDGIVAGGPALSVSEGWVNGMWMNRALIDERGEPRLSPADLRLLHAAVVAKCDMNDGVKDGLIGDPRLCKFDPEELSCARHKGENCLSAFKIDAVREIYRGPVTSTGTPLSLPRVFVGSELSWLDWFGGSDLAPTRGHTYSLDWIRYYLLQPSPGPSWTTRNLDFDHDYQRFGIAQLTEPVNPDLRRFKDRNGKLLMYTGWNDAIEGVGRTIDYYETAERVAGGRASTQNFLRLFVVPGMEHCTGGDGAFAIDYLSYIERWVESGHAPEKVIGSHVKLDDLMDKAMKGDQDAWHALERRVEFPLDPATIEFTRPIYPYPTQAKYLGHGDTHDAENFGPSRP